MSQMSRFVRASQTCRQTNLCSITNELLALNEYFPAVDLRLGEGEWFHLFLSYTAKHFDLKLFKSGTPKVLKLLTDDLRTRL
jgi:hypothetical protein